MVEEQLATIDIMHVHVHMYIHHFHFVLRSYNNWSLIIIMTVPDHSAEDIEILVPRCSALFTLCNGEVRIAIA